MAYDENGIYKISRLQYLRAKENGISCSVLYNRVNNLYWDIEKAISTPMKRKAGNSKYFTKEQIQIMVKNGITLETASARIKRLGWSVEKSIYTPPRKRTVK